MFSALLAITHSTGVCKGLVPLLTVARCLDMLIACHMFYTFVGNSVRIPYFRVSKSL